MREGEGRKRGGEERGVEGRERGVEGRERGVEEIEGWKERETKEDEGEKGSELSVSVMQAGVTCTNFSNYTAWKWQLEKKNHDLAPELAAYTLTRSFSYASHQCGRDSLTPNCHIYTVAGGSQYYGHLRPTPEGSVRWYARGASTMCMCMSPRARWKMVHRSYLYMLSVSVMQAGVTCTNFSNYTAWKWQHWWLA